MLPEPLHVRQLDGTRWAAANCTPASAAMALDAATRGMIRTTPAILRASQDDHDGGIGLDDAAVALARRYRVRFDFGRPSVDTLAARLRAREGFVLQLTYGRLGAWRAPGSTFAGGHALYVSHFHSNGTDALAFDPLRTGRRWVPWSLLVDGYLADPGYRAGWCLPPYPVTLPPDSLGHRPRAAAGWAELTGRVHVYRVGADKLARPAGTVDAPGALAWLGPAAWHPRASGGRWSLVPVLGGDRRLAGLYLPAAAGVIRWRRAIDG